jgi:hypothetical protein
MSIAKSVDEFWQVQDPMDDQLIKERCLISISGIRRKYLPAKHLGQVSREPFSARGQTSKHFFFYEFSSPWYKGRK